MSVYRPKNSPYYQFDFELGGHRFFGTTRLTSRREAEQFEALERVAAKTRVDALRAAKNGPLTLDLAIDRYWTEVGQHKVNKDDLWRDLGRIVDYFGGNRLLSDITDDDVAKLVAWRRGHRIPRKRKKPSKTPEPLITPATVNRTATKVLQRVFTRARDTWRIALPNAPHWRTHLLPEPAERIRELHDAEDDALSDVIWPDYEILRQFSLASGLRMAESLLHWSQVNFGEGFIARTGKGGQVVRLPITPEMREILMSRKGHHADMVFTYTAKRATQGRSRKARYPITRSGLKTHWRRSKAKAGIVDFRWHDNRHDFATKLLRKTKNLKLVQKALNHKKIETTLKYAHVLDDELRAGMIDAERDKKSRKKSRTNPGKVA